MGLDMYLSRLTYVKNWSFHKPENRWEITATKGGKPVKLDNVSYIKEEIGYWRKSNAIHDWFVKNCAKGVDDCLPVYVARESLQELLDEVNLVLENPTQAKERLPTASGCFFGSTDYDEYYMQDMQQTKEILEKALNESSEDSEFEYRASW